MLHPSYSDLMAVVNSEVEAGEQPIVQSRYSIVLATAKRARQIIAGDESLVSGKGRKPLSLAVEELYRGKMRILAEDEARKLEAAVKEQMDIAIAEKRRSLAEEAAKARAEAEEAAKKAAEEADENADGDTEA